MGDQFKVLGSILAATILCLITATDAEAGDPNGSEIIETDFAPADDAPIDKAETAPPSSFNLPAVLPPLQSVPAELIDEYEPAARRQLERWGGADVARSGSDGGTGTGADGSGASGGGAGSGDSGGGGSGGGSGGGGHGQGHGKGGSKK